MTLAGAGEHVVADERHELVEQARVARRAQVVADGEHRPEHDVAVRVLLARLGQRREELEGLRPVTAGVLGSQHPQQHVAHGVLAAERGEQADRPWHTSRVPHAPPENCSSPRGER